MLTKQAKILTQQQVKIVLAYLDTTRSPVRNRCIFLLSVKGTLRAAEIAKLKWEHVCGSDGQLMDYIDLTNDAAKGKKGGGRIPLNPELKRSLSDLLEETKGLRGFELNWSVIRTERSKSTSPAVIVNLFARWYGNLGFHGCSSHSGRRTAITNLAKKIHSVGGSLRDVQELARHSSLQTTQKYISGDEEAKLKVVGLI